MDKNEIQHQGQNSELRVDPDPYSLFLFAMNAPETKKKYVTRLSRFFDFIGLEQGTMEKRCRIFVDKSKANADSRYALNNTIRFLEFYKARVEEKEITGATVRNYVKSIKLFCEMNEITLPWKKITRGLPKARKYAVDRAPTIEEIRRIIEYPDRRIKGIVCSMASSGIRLGAWDDLQWKHILPMEKNNEIVAAKMVVYPGDPEEYFTFITPEAYLELEKCMNYRKDSGEDITGESWILRNIWDSRRGAKRGVVSEPVKLQPVAVKRIMENALWTQGLRKKLKPGQKRHEFQANHGLRKWFKTRCELAGMKSINIEKLLCHSIGISDSYYRITEKELLEDYLKAVDYLTICNEHTLQKQITSVIKEHDKNDDEVKVKLYNEEQEISSLTQNNSLNSDAIAALADQVALLMNKIQAIEKLK